MAHVQLTPAKHATLLELAEAQRAIVQELRADPGLDVSERLRWIADQMEWFADAYRKRG